jgi:glycosyltransferase involved in cell wall biosynthesis
VSAAALPRVLLVADRPGWAIENKARQLQRHLSDRYALRIVHQGDIREADLEADLVVIFYWLELLKMPLPEAALAACRERLLIGICSHFELEGERRAPGLAAIDRLARAVFANNRGLQREFAPLLRAPVHYTPNGVDTSLFRPAAHAPPREAGTLRVGWAGSLQNMGPGHRGFDEVIRPAIAATAGATLVAAVREERWLPHAAMPAFYAGLDAYVCASRNEGTPNTCLEAAACGVPLVTTAVGNMPELVRDGENALLFDGSAAHLAAQLARLRDEPATAAGLAAAMLGDIRAWDWRLQARRYARLFDAVLAPQREASGR